VNTVSTLSLVFNADCTMNHPQDRIPEEQTPEVFTLAAQLYARHNQSYSLKELMEAGAEAKIPPEFIQQAVEQIQLQRAQMQQPVSTQPSKPYLLALAIGIPILTALAVVGLIARNAMINAQEKQVPFETAVRSIPAEAPLNETTQPVSNFKCANLNLAGQDLSSQNLKGADCTNAKLGNANLSKVNLEGANLSNTDLKNANLSGAILKGTNLAKADLADADLTNANLEGANLSNTDLRNANLSGAILKGADWANAKLDGAKLDGAKR